MARSPRPTFPSFSARVGDRASGSRRRITSICSTFPGGAATLFTTATGAGSPGGLNNGFFESPGSAHAGGAFFALADGSVHFLADSIDAATATSVFPLLGSMADGQRASVDTARE